ncbi:hypothetical protein [Rhizomonospora bruguierae]|uniref:hypothetical protein n=1 Tax=Rhizomonospora bruguierae TaxID=1581705 RepID=UPI001BCB07D9|nr:hypothetical protein [Micromonospora sp. NBRC 107566]
MTAEVRAEARPEEPAAPPHRRAALWRWLPLVAGVAYFAAVLLHAGTGPLAVLRYAFYVGYGVLLPGTLVYRALRRRPHTLVEDLTMGAAVGLALELPAWALVAALGLQGWLWLWPLAVVVPFVAVPRLRGHWHVRGYVPTPIGWSWAVAGVVAFFTTYLSATFLQRNPVLPTDEGTYQYIDLAYQLSLAGEAKNQFPMHVPQVAEEPLFYHWFGYAHMASTGLIGHIDLVVVALRLAIPGLCALAVLLTAVVGWRVSGKPYAGAVAAALFWVIGEVNFTHFVTMPFGTQASFVIWHGMSMIYSWVLLLALIGTLADVVDRRVDRPVPALPLGAALALTAAFLLASSGAKASSIPVAAVALAIAALGLLVTRRRIPWLVVVAGLMAGGAQLFATAVLYRFQAYGVDVGPLYGLERFWAPPPAGPRGGVQQWLVVAAVWVAFLVNMQLRVAGIVPLLWRRRGRLEPVQWLLLGGALAGPGLYLVLMQPSDGNQYFTRAGFAFAVLLSGWGYVTVFERAGLSARWRAGLAVGAVAVAAALVAIQWRYAVPAAYDTPFTPLLPLLRWALALAVIGVLAGAVWLLLARPRLRGRGPVLALTAILLVGAPGLVMDMKKSIEVPNGGAYANVPMPLSRVTAARWVRDHSDRHDVVATNAHCVQVVDGWCDSRSFWLSAYAERRVLIEGWGFAPRAAPQSPYNPFWDQALQQLNDAAFTAPTAEVLRELAARHGVRWLVVDRSAGAESPDLAGLASKRFETGDLAVYALPEAA